MEKAGEQDWNGSSDSQDSIGDNGFGRRSILSYDRINVRNLNLTEVVSRMNHLRQTPGSPEGAASTSISRSSSGTSRTASDTSRSPQSSKDSSSSSTPRSEKGKLSPRVTFYPEFRKKSTTLDALNLDNIPAACARSAQVSPRHSDTCMHPFRFQFFGYQSGDTASSPRIRLPLLISPIRCSRMNPRLLPRNPLGLGYCSSPRTHASRAFLTSEFVRSSKERLSRNEQQTKPGKFEEEKTDKSNNKDHGKFDSNKGSTKSEPNESESQAKSCKSGNVEEPETAYDSE